MFWTVVGLGVLINGIAVGGSYLARTRTEPSRPPASRPQVGLRNDHRVPADAATRAQSAKEQLHLAEVALRQHDRLQARQHVYNAVRSLEGVDGAEALLSYARRMLDTVSDQPA